MDKARSFEEIYRQADQFVLNWKDAAGDERQEAQMFVRDLLSVYGLSDSRAALYERRARRSSTGSQGYIDALVPGILAIEMKSEGKSLVKAEEQALDYLQGLPNAEFPDWVLTSDFKTFRLLNLKEGSDTHAAEWDLKEFHEHADKLSFLAGYGQRVLSFEEREAASVKAAQLMASLYEGLSDSGYDDHSASVFLVRSLFMLYADDTALWGERDLFLEFLENRTSDDGGDLGSQMNLLFQVLRTPVEKRQKNITGLLARFPYVNGGLFEEVVDIPFFDADMRTHLIEACYFNWSAISPAIFGSLFQAVKDKAARRALGAHYTTERNILRVIGPLFLDELKTEFESKKDSVQGLRNMRSRIGEMQFLDPACGCGNFLIIAYREMRALELRIIERIQKLDRGRKSASVLDQGLFFMGDQVSVRVRNFHGIELEDWPARIANTALHLVEHQANQEMQARLGTAPELLPLDKVETIHTGNALHMDWTEVVAPADNLCILGNPPFLGHVTRDAEQAEDLKVAWKTRKPGRLDYVTAWYAKTLDFFGSEINGRWAFVSTNSITQGDQAARVFSAVFEAGWRIRFGHRTFAWSSEAPGAAAVHCVIVGLDKQSTPAPRLFSYSRSRGEPFEDQASSINAYLVDGPKVLVRGRSEVLSNDLPSPVYGSLPADGGNLIVTPDEYAAVAADLYMGKYLRRFVGAKELLHGTDRWCLWLEDLDGADVAKSAELQRRLEAVREMRSASTLASTREKAATPHLFYFNGHPSERYLCIPRTVSEHRPYFVATSYDPDVVSSDANSTVVDPDGFAFAVVSSSMFLTWQKTVGGRLKSDIRFSKKQTWNTFPLPKPSGSQRAQIVDAGERVLEVRAEHTDKSLAALYHHLAMPRDLIRAHDKLDAAVDRLFGAKRTCQSEKERQEILFKRYVEMTP
ncbi:class I SAM-dependent DNA methyltransferase [Nesterenkonia sp. E16_7]|uniref:class I SAM-dependent DNA methyltransferase n=1 Tax=unclassified Nesterenkonia TaxID=2629769 RepID=UPI001A9235E3|nr:MULTISPECIES: DNA methyltransferase [unclassified Nesterenkonia]MBO0596805.1 class I SAM-dependent DNA methyltransferase [Nesterenkonia sp. E16_10]MBO0600010.1 class I SAM-dependent DNA methyltransferase [Nesterenkonia sp. E16_7]